jgi:hypothetical protein
VIQIWNVRASLFSAMKHVGVYFQESSIHGFTYIVNRDLHVTEKVLWAVVLVISFGCCGVLIYKIGVKMQEDAMVTYTSDTAIDIKDVSPFYKKRMFRSFIDFFFLFLEDSISCRDILS